MLLLSQFNSCRLLNLSRFGIYVNFLFDKSIIVTSSGRLFK